MNIFVFKVALFHEKRIYRKIAIEGDQMLSNLHETIFHSFDRYDNAALYTFYFPAKRTQSIMVIRESLQYTHPFNYERNYRGLDVGLDVGDASDKLIESLNLELKQKFYYLFDFRDEWWHEITFEKLVKNNGGEY